MLIASSDSLVADLGIYANDSARQLISMQVLLAFLNIGVHMLMLYLILRILKPIKLLTKAAIAVREGDLDASVSIVGSDELHDLCESFNSMLNSLKESANSLASEKSKYQDLYDSAPDLYRVVDRDGILIDCNRSYVESLGYTRKEELIGKSIFERTAEPSLEAMHESFEEWKRTGNIVNKEVWLKRKDGSTFPTLISATPIYGANGSIVASNTAIIDVSEIYAAKRQLEKANARLKELDRMKSEFVSVASHELRTPIQPIMGVAVLAARGAIKNEEAWAIVIREAKRLQHLANDLLDVTRIEGGDIQLRKERFCINEVIRHIVHEGKLSRRENVQIKLELAADDDLNLDADKSRITQVINNLLGNAIKFTKTGSISIVTKTIYDRRYLEMFVTDTGGGIPEAILPMLFSKFATKSVDAGTEHGTGLGLYICKEIIGAHGGSITGFNNDTGGATFRVLLPISRSSFSPEERTTYAE
jgi:PAS domain S-box-containing protein